jgi:hypothetical protein
MADGLTREFLAERDNRIFAMRKGGVSAAEIAKRFGISTGAVNAAINRQLQRLNREALMAYPEVLRMELERLDALQQAIWPLTQHRKVEAPDGTEMVVEPDLKAIQQVLSIMDRRSKLLGMETAQVSISVETNEQAPQRAVLAGADQAAAADAFDPETEARQLLELMGSSGVLPPDKVAEMLGREVSRAGQPELVAPLEVEVIHDAEVIE